MEDTIGVWFWDMGKRGSSGGSHGKGKGKGKGKGSHSKGNRLHTESHRRDKYLYVLTNRLTGERRVCHTQRECAAVIGVSQQAVSLALVRDRFRVGNWYIEFPPRVYMYLCERGDEVGIGVAVEGAESSDAIVSSRIDVSEEFYGKRYDMMLTDNFFVALFGKD